MLQQIELKEGIWLKLVVLVEHLERVELLEQVVEKVVGYSL
jgi:hypothetical protein